MSRPPEKSARAKQARTGERPQTEKPGFETGDAPPRPVMALVLVLFAGIILSGALVAGLLLLIARAHPPSHPTVLEAQRTTPPEPRLEIDPAADRARLEAQAEARLRGFEWTNKAAGRARIPIEAAMRLTAEQGWADPAGKPQP